MIVDLNCFAEGIDSEKELFCDISPDECNKPRVFFVPILKRSAALHPKPFDVNDVRSDAGHIDFPQRLASKSNIDLLVSLDPDKFARATRPSDRFSGIGVDLR